MKLIKSIMSAFAIVLATTACAGNGGENKKSNEPTKEDNKMEVVSLNKAEFLKKVYDFEANPNDWKFEGKRYCRQRSIIGMHTLHSWTL